MNIPQLYDSKKITELATLSSASLSCQDIVPIVDVSAKETKSISITELNKGLYPLHTCCSDYSTLAQSSVTASYANSAGNAVTSDYSTNAGYSINSGFADCSGFSDCSNHATCADTASYALTAGGITGIATVGTITNINAGYGISVTNPSGPSTTVINSGVTKIIAGTGISVNSNTGDVTISSGVIGSNIGAKAFILFDYHGDTQPITSSVFNINTFNSYGTGTSRGCGDPIRYIVNFTTPMNSSNYIINGQGFAEDFREYAIQLLPLMQTGGSFNLPVCKTQNTVWLTGVGNNGGIHHVYQGSFMVFEYP